MSRLLRENLSGAEADVCTFSCTLSEQEAVFFFDVRDDELVSPFRTDNEDIWKGDAVEVFLSPDGSKERYFEAEVSPYGVRFWGEVTFAGGEKRLKKLPPPFTAAVRRTARGYTAELHFPPSALAGFDGARALFNAFCIDTRLDGAQRLYALSPTRCATFHRPEAFIPIGNIKEELS